MEDKITDREIKLEISNIYLKFSKLGNRKTNKPHKIKG